MEQKGENRGRRRPRPRPEALRQKRRHSDCPPRAPYDICCVPPPGYSLSSATCAPRRGPRAARLVLRSAPIAILPEGSARNPSCASRRPAPTHDVHCAREARAGRQERDWGAETVAARARNNKAYFHVLGVATRTLCPSVSRGLDPSNYVLSTRCIASSLNTFFCVRWRVTLWDRRGVTS